ncbi:MAG: hypothetical protein WCK39_00950 [Methanomassiliicoccales archaeon]
MAYTEQNFAVFKGEGRRIRITVKDENDKPLDLTDFTDIKWRLAKSFKDPLPLVDKTLDGLDGDIVIEDGPGGVVIVRIRPEDIPTKVGAYLHEMRITEDEDSISTVMTGVMTVKESLFGSDVAPAVP